jgi:soluble cytochrome b562
MNKFMKMITLTIALTVVLSACSGANDNNGNVTEGSGSENSSNQSSNSGSGSGNSNDDSNNAVDSDNGNVNGSTGNEAGGDGNGSIGSNGGGEDSNSGSDKEQPITGNGDLTAAGIIEQMTSAVEQPSMITLEPEMVQDLYHLDPALLEDYMIKLPMMNIKTNEIAILKVKDTADLKAVQAAVEQRAADVQKQFEQYLPDQYENAKNYKLIIEGNTILFVISESADELVAAFNEIIAQ